MSLTAVVEGNEIKYHVMDPTGNITILVETPVEEASQPFIAAELMQREPDAEQVGFLTLSKQSADDRKFCDIALRMAGGEFCGNATMSAAAFYAARNSMQEGTVTVRVSGAAEPVPVEICLASAESAPVESGLASGEPDPADICPASSESVPAEIRSAEAEPVCRQDFQTSPVPVYRGTVTMPRPVAITEVKLPVSTVIRSESVQEPKGVRRQTKLPSSGQKSHNPAETYCTYPVVHFEGIDHVILEGEPEGIRAEELAPLWCRELQAEAVGLMFLNRTEGTLTPLVYVPEAGTLVWENSCASGTSAVGAWAASRCQTADPYPSSSQETAGGRESAVQLSLQEPGGILRVEVSADGEIRLTGTVRER